MEDIRLESFPFDSKLSGYDDYGYPVYDRAVGATMLRQTFRQFFSSGIFGTPSNAFSIREAEGLAVTVLEGVSVILGAMSSIPDGGQMVKLTDETETVGTYAYGIFLRYDENVENRSCYIQVRKGDADVEPVPPEPDRESPGIYELRIGYVVVPSGSTDLSGAKIVEEKGLEVCPYAAPFEEIDVSGILDNLKLHTKEEYDAYKAYVDEYFALVESAVDGTTAADLRKEIDDLKKYVDEKIATINASGLVDNLTTSATSDGKIEVKDGAISTGKLADGSVTTGKISDDSKLEVVNYGVSNRISYSIEKKEDTGVTLAPMVYDEETLRDYIDLSSSDFFNVSGFTPDSSDQSITFPFYCFAIIDFVARFSGGSKDTFIIINGIDAIKLKLSETTTRFTYFLVFNSGDKIRIALKGEGAPYLNDFTIQVI